jgi:hypothetical protein
MARRQRIGTLLDNVRRWLIAAGAAMAWTLGNGVDGGDDPQSLYIVPPLI